MLLFSLALSLVACSARFERDGDGFGYTNEKSGVHYTVLGTAYEAARAGEPVGEYRDRKHDVTKTFYEIPGLDVAQFVTDGSGAVYCADDVLPNVADFTLTALHICEEDAISLEIARITESTTLTALRSAWLTGEETELPLDRASRSRRIKFEGAEYPNIYYCVSFFVYENGDGYLYLAEERRAVALSAELVAALLATEGVAQ